VGLFENLSWAVLGDRVDRLLVITPLEVAVLVGELRAGLERPGDEQVDSLVNRVAVGLEDVIVVLAEPIE